MMQATNVNAIGLQEIKTFLAANHKKGGDHFTRDMLQAWAADAEFQLSEGNPATIEIKSWDSIHGCAQEYRISDAGLDWSEVWEAWEDGQREGAVRFLVPLGGTFDVAESGASALGVEVSEVLNVARV